MSDNNGWLTENEFRRACAALPLVSVDLYFVNGADKGRHLLLGLRNNRPAQNYWFTPGGRIRKGERLDDAVTRISLEETGFSIDELLRYRLLGIWDHLYTDSAFDERSPVHYVNIAFLIQERNLIMNRLPASSVLQHRAWRWIALEEIQGANEVHPYVKNTAAVLSA